MTELIGQSNVASVNITGQTLVAVVNLCSLIHLHAIENPFVLNLVTSIDGTCSATIVPKVFVFGKGCGGSTLGLENNHGRRGVAE